MDSMSGSMASDTEIQDEEAGMDAERPEPRTPIGAYLTYEDLFGTGNLKTELEDTPLSKAQRRRRNRKRNRATRETRYTAHRTSSTEDEQSLHQDETDILSLDPQSGALHGLYGARTDFPSVLNLVQDEHVTFVKPNLSEKSRRRIQRGNATLAQAGIVCGCCGKVVAICERCKLPKKGPLQDAWHTCHRCQKPVNPARLDMAASTSDHFSESPFMQGMIEDALDERRNQIQTNSEAQGPQESVWNRIKRIKDGKL